ncbi:phytoene desaturase family protein [Acidicapsa acidisoli]|uniref:phytoene desaturase family protein n=1 Tax=Acidicapsa acidisoli TaxID=1615681 RepID=UPI0021E0920D|nr:NAD(P)/FAD-dependent oxidoreductase [Acidicapsa acidisoli]
MPRAAIVGSGPNGLSAAITLAQAGIETRVYEGRDTIGGAASTAEVTLPGFCHDLGASVFPMAAASPFFQPLPLRDFGLNWIEPSAPLAHPLDDGTAVMLEHDLVATADGLGVDGAAWTRLMRPLIDHWPNLCREILGPVIHWPSHPILMAHFGIFAALPAATLARTIFRGARARALFAGNAAHSVLPLESPFSSAVALVLAAAGQTTGWPIAAGGAQPISDALAGYLQSLGGRIEPGHSVQSPTELQGFDAILCDISPRGLLAIARSELPASYNHQLTNYRFGPGAFKVDWALSEPIPWKARDCLRAATVHVGGTFEEIAASERAPWASQEAKRGTEQWTGQVPEKPFVLVTQPSLFDPGRAPEGKHTAWGYCHVPNGYAGSSEAVLNAIESQVRRFAPGFRDCILARRVTSTAQFESWNPNLVGGDLSGGAMTLRQLIFRPTPTLYRTPRQGLYLCSASTPPGGGVHGMCGHQAAIAALQDLSGKRRK